MISTDKHLHVIFASLLKALDIQINNHIYTDDISVVKLVTVDIFLLQFNRISLR